MDEISERLLKANFNGFDDKPGKSLDKQKCRFRGKIFQPRESLLTDLFQMKHFSAAYYFFATTLILFFLDSAVKDISKRKISKFGGYDLIVWNFRSTPLSILIWLGMQSTTLLLYYVYKVWGTYRIFLAPNTRNIKIWDATFLLLAVAYQIIFLIVPASLILHCNISMACSFFLVTEQKRFMMKTYAFIRLNAPRVLNHECSRKKENTSSVIVPAFNKYLYFLFAPTLIYKDEYPRTSIIRWRIVIYHFINFFGAFFFAVFLFDKYIIPSTKDFGKEELNLERLSSTVIGNCIPMTILIILLFFGVFHSWENGFSEMLRFADRTFYTDWWNSSSFKEYYPKWNAVVYDWVHTFIYLEAEENLKLSKSTSIWLGNLIPALFHDYLLSLTFKFITPLFMIVQGGILTGFLFSTKLGNFSFLFNLCLGGGFHTLYMFEYYARVNCPIDTVSPVQDFFIPRIWTCYGF